MSEQHFLHPCTLKCSVKWNMLANTCADINKLQTSSLSLLKPLLLEEGKWTTEFLLINLFYHVPQKKQAPKTTEYGAICNKALQNSVAYASNCHIVYLP